MMEKKGNYKLNKKNNIDDSLLKESNPSFSVQIVENKNNGKKYLVESVSTEEILRRRNPAYKFLM